MANISAELQAILSAIYGEDVRGSIHDAIEKINDVSEVVLSCGTDISSTTSSSSGYYENSFYINTTTCDLWRCVGTNSWSLDGNLRGIGITSITLKSTANLVDTYEITYSDGTTTTFDITNGRGITSIAKSGMNFNVDTYTITYNDGSTTDFDVTNGIDGTHGNKWYRGTDINGKQTNPTVFANSGITLARKDDYYLNPSEGSIYYCVLSGDPATALWVYDFTLAGGGSGVSTWGDLTNKPFNYVGGGGLEITGATANDYTLQAKVDGSYIKTDSNGALTINPDVLKGVYKYNTDDFRTDDTNKIVYLSNAIQNKIKNLDNNGKIDASKVIYGNSDVDTTLDTITGKTANIDEWHKVSGSVQIQTVTVADTSTSISFSDLNSSKAYDLYFETPDGSMPTLESSTISGTTITYSVKTSSVPTNFKLRVIN